VEYELTNKKTILVVGIVKDIYKSIEKDIANIEKALKIFKTVNWFLVESDSKDQSLKKLGEIANKRSNFQFVSLGSLQKSNESRTIGMSLARNRYLSEIRLNENFSQVDLVAIADFNGLNDELNEQGIYSCFMRSDWDACFANQTGRYYDIWALRHPLWSPNDSWQQLNFYREFVKFPERALRISLGSRMIHIPKKNNWIEVDSAFGGFGLYKRDALNEGEYSGITSNGTPICEHVPFHAELRKNGKRLFVNPALINTKSTDHSKRFKLKGTMYRLLKYPFKIIRKWFKKFLKKK
jgi:hypothetical protein